MTIKTRDSKLNINYTDCKYCENYSQYPCGDCENNEYFAFVEDCHVDYDYYVHDGHTRKTFRKVKGSWTCFPLYTDEYPINKQLTDMEYKRQNWEQ